jgi:hypothetical protein
MARTDRPLRRKVPQHDAIKHDGGESHMTWKLVVVGSFAALALAASIGASAACDSGKTVCSGPGVGPFAQAFGGNGHGGYDGYLKRRRVKSDDRLAWDGGVTGGNGHGGYDGYLKKWSGNGFGGYDGYMKTPTMKTPTKQRVVKKPPE